MEEQRARQEAENTASGGAQAGEGEGAQAPAAGAGEAVTASATEEDDPVLARALAMSVGESADASAEPDLSAMTEDEQIAYAMRMSMQAEEGSSGPSGASEEKMDVDEPSGSSEKKDDDYSEAMNDPAFLQVNNTCAEKNTGCHNKFSTRSHKLPKKFEQCRYHFILTKFFDRKKFKLIEISTKTCRKNLFGRPVCFLCTNIHI